MIKKKNQLLVVFFFSPPGKQIFGTRLRISQVSAADSGEYVCYVNDGTSRLETSIIVSIPSSSGGPHSRSPGSLWQTSSWPERELGRKGNWGAGQRGTTFLFLCSFCHDPAGADRILLFLPRRGADPGAELPRGWPDTPQNHLVQERGTPPPQPPGRGGKALLLCFTRARVAILGLQPAQLLSGDGGPAGEPKAKGGAPLR